MGGTSMAVEKRWATDPFYRDTVFAGSVLDIGGAGDCIARYRTQLPRLGRVTGLDLDVQPDGLHDTDWLQMPATQLPAGLTFDTVYSSHCLEHIEQHLLPVMRDAMWRAVKPGGYLLLIVPHMEMYERGHWPSRFNCDHKTRWVRRREDSDPHDVIGLHDYVSALPDAELISLKLLDAGFSPGPYDQTANGSCESGIEAVVRKTV